MYLLCRLEVVNTELQKLIAHESYVHQRWFFHRLITLYISLLKQALLWEDTKSLSKLNTFISLVSFPNTKNLIPLSDIQFPTHPSTDDLKRMPIELTFSAIAITSEKQFENIVKCCISVLTSSILHYCNIIPDLAIKSREVILDVFCQKSLIYKMKSIEFFTVYFDTLATFTDTDTQFFLVIMETLTLIFKNIPTMMINESRATLDGLNVPIESFLRKAPVGRMQFDNQQRQQRLMISVCEILYHQLKNGNQSWVNGNLQELFASMIMEVLDNFEFTLQIVESLRVLLEFGDQPSIVALMKYLVPAELEDAVNLRSQKIEVAVVSKSWKSICDGLIRYVDGLSKIARQQQFVEYFYRISEYFLLAVQIEFRVSRRLQYLQGMRVPENGNHLVINGIPDPIQLVLFDNIEYIVQELLSAIDKREFDGGIARCSMDIFACILQLSKDADIADNLKQVLVAIIASPFYECYNDNPTYRKLGGFQKIMPLLPENFKVYFSGQIDVVCLNVMRCDSISLLSQLEISKIHNTCWWLIENIMVYITSDGNEELKMSLYNSFVNFSLNNKICFCFEKYEKLLKEVHDPILAIHPLSEMLCLAGGDVVVLKLLSTENNFKHLIVCNKCELSTTIYPKSAYTNEVQRLLAIMQDTKGLIVPRKRNESKNLRINVPQILGQSKEFIIELFPKIPALLNHSASLQVFIEEDNGKQFFEKIFVKDQKVLEHLNENFKDVVINIQKFVGEDKQRKEILNNCFLQIAEIAKFTAYENDLKVQSLAVRLNFTFGIHVVDENSMVKCFKISLMYIIQNNSKIMGEASELALSMAQRNGVSLVQLFNWHRTFIMRHVTLLVITNYLRFNIGFSSALVNVSCKTSIS